jgi:hypothetical protein
VPPDVLEGWVDPASVHASGDPGRYQFTYYAAPLPAGGDVLKRPHFAFSFTDGTSGYTSSKLQTARPPNKCDFARSDSERKSHCFGDPNFPLVWSRYDFREMVYYRSPTDSVALTDAAYVETSMDAAAIQAFLGQHNSQLANFYFVGDPASFTTLNPDAGVWAANNPQGWPGGYFDLNGNGTFDSEIDFYYMPPVENTSAQVPEDGYPGFSFAEILSAWCSSKHVSPKVMLTHLQKEETAIDGPPGNDWLALQKVLYKIMGYQPGVAAYAWPSVQIAHAVSSSRSYFDSAPEGLPVAADPPHDGELKVVKDYGWPPRAATTDQDERFRLGPGQDMPVAFYLHTKAGHALFRYTNEVNVGNVSFMRIWSDFGFGQ